MGDQNVKDEGWAGGHNISYKPYYFWLGHYLDAGVKVCKMREDQARKWKQLGIRSAHKEKDTIVRIINVGITTNEVEYKNLYYNTGLRIADRPTTPKTIAAFHEMYRKLSLDEYSHCPGESTQGHRSLTRIKEDKTCTVCEWSRKPSQSERKFRGCEKCEWYVCVKCWDADRVEL